MSKATKRKHVTKEVLDQYVLPEGKKEIVKVIMDYLNHVTLLLVIAWQLDAVWLYPPGPSAWGFYIILEPCEQFYGCTQKEI